MPWQKYKPTIATATRGVLDKRKHNSVGEDGEKRLRSSRNKRIILGTEFFSSIIDNVRAREILYRLSNLKHYRNGYHGATGLAFVDAWFPVRHEASHTHGFVVEQFACTLHQF